jgi:hypothetical protein
VKKLKSTLNSSAAKAGKARHVSDTSCAAMRDETPGQHPVDKTHGCVTALSAYRAWAAREVQ